MGNNTLVIILIIIAVLLVSLIIGVIVLFLKVKNNQSKDYSKDISEIRDSIIKSTGDTKDAIKDEFINTQKLLSDQIKDQNKEISDFKENVIKNNNDNNQALLRSFDERFNNTNTNIGNKFDHLTEKLGKKMEGTDDKLQNNLKEGFKTNIDHLGKVNEALGKITKSQENLDSLNSQVTKLNNVFSNSQLRGRFGEIQLEKILEIIFGDTRDIYSFQYEFKAKRNGEPLRPDAVVFFGDEDNTFLCIDSKFSFVEYEKVFEENPRDIDSSKTVQLKSALQKQIRKISEDYIVTGKTYTYALMFIPSDSIFTFIQLNDYLYENIIEYALKLKVIICSPSTIQPILANINVLRINNQLSRNIKEVITEINKVSQSSAKLVQSWDSFEKTLNSLIKKKDAFHKKVHDLGDKTKNVITVAVKKDIITNDELIIEDNSNNIDDEDEENIDNI